jgi:hypothetical protein
MKKLAYIFMLMGLCVLFNSCGSRRGGGRAPSTFVRSTDGGTWSAILIRDDLSYDQAFNEVLDVMAKQFEMDMISKDGGYGRTQWSYTWNLNGTYTQKYRTRVIFKFSGDRKKVDIKTEAEFGGEPLWIKGYDTRLLSTIKQDVMGVVSRTTF